MGGSTLFILVYISAVITMNIPKILSKEPEDCSGTDCPHSRLEEEQAPKCPGISVTRLKGYRPPPNLNPNDSRYGKARPWKAGDGSLDACVRHCCENPPCNYAYMANGMCYQFTCGEDPKKCSPEKRRGGHPDETPMVLVRPPQKFRGCRRDNAKYKCMPNEICAHDNGRLICKCPGNFTTDSAGNCINPDVKRTVAGTVRPNQPPVAHAGGNQTIAFPSDIVILNGSLSADDFGIKRWKWERSSESSAAGVVIGDSDTTPILMYRPLYSGKYVYTLTVTDEQGLTASDKATVNVIHDSQRKDLIRVVLDVPKTSLTEAELSQLEQCRLPLAKFKLGPIQSETNNGNAMLLFYSDASNKTIAGSELLRELVKVADTLPYTVLSFGRALDLDSFTKADLDRLQKDLPSRLPGTKFVLKYVQSEGNSNGNVMLVFYRTDVSRKTKVVSQLLRDLAEVADTFLYPFLSIGRALPVHLAATSCPEMTTTASFLAWSLFGLLFLVIAAIVACTCAICVRNPFIKRQPSPANGEGDELNPNTPHANYDDSRKCHKY